MLALVLLLLLAGCDSASVDESEPPSTISPAVFEVHAFEASASKSSAGENLKAALTRYVPVSITLGVQYLLIPALVTEFVTEVDPVSLDGAWVWETEKQTEQGTFSARLTGRPNESSVDWMMEVSGNNPHTGRLEDFVLYTARTQAEGRSGTWDLFFPIDGEPVNILDAEFVIENPVEKQITFVVPETAPRYAGYEVRYEREDNDRLFYWYQPDVDEEHILIWNPVSGVGSIQSTNYKDGARYCWNAAGEDVECA